MTHRLAFVVVLALVATAAAAVVLPATPASAHHCTGEGDIDDGGGGVTGECHGVTPGRPGTSDVRVLWNSYCLGASDSLGEWVDIPDVVEVIFRYVGDLDEETVADLGYDPTGVYSWYDILCWSTALAPPDYIDVGVVIFEQTPPVPVTVLRDRARARIDPPVPRPAAAPPLDNVIVKAPTWLWMDATDWTPLSETECQGFTCVTVEAVPILAVWDMGEDGDLVECTGPGTPWTPGAGDESPTCGYEYDDSSAVTATGVFDATVTVVWEFSWWINVTPQGPFGTFDAVAGFPVDVDEIQAVETGN